MNKSHLTAIKRNKLSAPMAYLSENGLLTGKLLDYGCGRGEDADRLSMDKFDPHYFNVHPLPVEYDTITCNYVLNVIEDENRRRAVVQNIFNCLKQNGTAYITVRRDKFNEGYTKKGTYQALVTLNFPVLVEKKGRFITYILKKNNKGEMIR